MRPFVLLFILLNILFFLWGKYIHTEPDSDTTRKRSTQVEQLVLQSEVHESLPKTELEPEIPAQVEPSAEQDEAEEEPQVLEQEKEDEEDTQAADQANEEAPVEEEQTSESKPELPPVMSSLPSESAEAEEKAPDEPNEKESALQQIVENTVSASDLCFTVGPFETEADTADAVVKLVDVGLNPSERILTEKEIAYYRVYIAPPNSQTVSLTTKALKDKGIREFYVMTEAGMENMISLGLFKERRNALKKEKELKKKGFDARLKTRYREKELHWLDYKDNETVVTSEQLKRWFPNDVLHRLERECHSL